MCMRFSHAFSHFFCVGYSAVLVAVLHVQSVLLKSYGLKFKLYLQIIIFKNRLSWNFWY